jgi:hypothetical protein
MNQHQEFKFEGFLQPDGSLRQSMTPDHAPVHKTALGAPVNLAADATEAARIGFEIKQRPVAEWKDAIQNASEPLRERVRLYLVHEWQLMKERHQRDSVRLRRESDGGKKTPAGDEALAALAKRFGKV